MNPPKISIITPSFNQGRFLSQCIESVLSQDYRPMEYIIIDGGSNDQSVEVIRRYADSLTYWTSEPDNGQSNAINKGFSRATGELVAWLNADDFYLPGALHKVAQAWCKTPGRPFYFGDGWRVDERGRRLANFFPDGRILFNHQALVMGLNFILQPSSFINRAILEQIGSLNASLHYGMDSDLWLRLAAQGTPGTISHPLSATREYGQTKTSTGSFARVEELRQIAQRHAGLPMTPGTICYWLDTLHKMIREHEDIFPKSYRHNLEAFWASTSALLSRFDAGPDGFPRKGDPD